MTKDMEAILVDITKKANKNFFVIVNQDGGNDVTLQGHLPHTVI
jgi:hypothetical protein